MPIIKRAIKKLKHDRRRTEEREVFLRSLEKIVKSARRGATPKKISQAFKSLDKATKLHLIHSNKAARLKARLSKLLKKK